MGAHLQLLEELFQLVLQSLRCGLAAARREQAARCPCAWLLLNEALHIPQHTPASKTLSGSSHNCMIDIGPQVGIAGPMIPQLREAPAPCVNIHVTSSPLL